NIFGILIIMISAMKIVKLTYQVTKWKSLCVEKTCYVAGLMERNVAIASIQLNADRNGFLQESYVIKLNQKPTDVALFQHWNDNSKKPDIIAVIATEKSELLWFKIEETQHVTIFFWSWFLQKNISHINIFQVEYDYQILIITKLSTETTGDLLRQKIQLSDLALSSAVVNVGPDYFLSIPQKSLKSLLVFKLKDNHFLSYKNLTSDGIDDVISFKIASKAFLAFNGINAGIYRFTENDLVREKVVDMHFEGVNYWLPIHVTTFGDEIILMAQRSLVIGIHKSFVIEIITYNGDKFEEHEDVRCLYFGEDVLGLSCLPGEESEKGIVGATSISLDDVLGLLIPRENGFSELFTMQTDVKKKSNPLQHQLEEFVKQRQRLNDLITEQEKRYTEIVANPQQIFDPDSIKTQLQKINQDVDLMKDRIDSVTNPTHYKKIIFNGLVEVQSDANFEAIEVAKIDGQLANDVLGDIVLKDEMAPILSLKIFQDLEIVDLNFVRVNNIDSSNLLFISDNITINHNLILAKSLIVQENVTADEVNGIIFENEVVDLNSLADDLVFEKVEVLGNVEVNEINNFPILQAFEDLKFDSENMQFDTLYIPYSMVVENVNDENFNEFLEQLCLKNIKTYIPGITNVIGDIMVRGNAKTEYLNKLKFPKEYVFTDNSFTNITGEKNFASTLITSNLNCDGTIDDVYTPRIITLTTNQNVTGTTTFKNLKVTESLDVAGNVLGEQANKFLPNPVLLDTSFIKANVHFKNLEVEGSIILTENFNGKHFETLLSDIVYTNEEPVIEAMKQFPEGFTVRTNLLISSNSINDINLNSIVTKDTDQILNITTLRGIVNFGNIDTDGLYDSIDIRELDDTVVKLDGEQYISSTLVFEDNIDVNELEIFETINDVSQDQFLNETRIEEIGESVENIIVEGSIFGDIDGFNLAEFDRRKLSFTKDQVIESNYNIEKSFMENMESVQINNVETYEFSQDFLLENLKKELLAGKLEVKNCHVDSLDVDQINSKTTIDLGGSLWKNGVKKYNVTSLIFNDDTYFNSMQIENLSGVSFSRFIKNIVFKNETNPKLTGRKTFLQGLTVKKLIETDKLNHMVLADILTKQGRQEISGSVTIHGNVFFDNNVIVSESINNISVSSITENYQLNNDEIKVKEIRGYVNDKLAQKFVDDIVYKEGDFRLQGETIFENNVDIKRNIRVVGYTNNIDLTAFASNVVMVTKDTDIKGPVRFKDPVDVENRITLFGNMKTQTLNGIDLQSWTENAIFVNKGYLKATTEQKIVNMIVGNYVLEEVEIVDSLYAEYINDINTNTLIPLRSQQNLTELSFEEIGSFNDIFVGNSTNYRNLSDEFINTVLTMSDEEIDSDVEFVGNVYVEGDMKLLGQLNYMGTNKIVTTNTNQNLTAFYNFKSKVALEKNLKVSELVNGIDVTNWMIEGVRTSSPFPQNVTHNWLIQQDLIFEEDANGQALINGLDLQKFRQEVEDKRNYKYAIEKGFIHFRFVKSVAFGLISQIISVHNDDLLYFVIRSQPVCDIQGTNIWQLIDNGFMNMAFVPRNLATGLALRTGKKLIRLNRDDSIIDDFSYEAETVIRGNFTEEFNTYLPGRKESDLVVMKVGIRSSKRSLLAVASHEETSVKGSLDFIKIYEDVVTGKVFHKVPTYKPSSLVSLQFNNGETLLAFMEDESVLQVYEYKGIEGFKHKLSAKLEGSELFTMTLQRYKKERKIVGLVDKKRISLIEAVMLGNQIEDNLQCSL
ncbi:uncharacterized protein BDFB_000451, partial [Asbolus verrucosus]